MSIPRSRNQSSKFYQNARRFAAHFEFGCTLRLCSETVIEARSDRMEVASRESKLSRRGAMAAAALMPGGEQVNGGGEAVQGVVDLLRFMNDPQILGER